MYSSLIKNTLNPLPSLSLFPPTQGQISLGTPQRNESPANQSSLLAQGKHQVQSPAQNVIWENTYKSKRSQGVKVQVSKKITTKWT